MPKRQREDEIGESEAPRKKRKKANVITELHDKSIAVETVLSQRVREDFDHALAFVQRTHQNDLLWIRSRNVMVEHFSDFFQEYVYVIIASGFKALHAARLTPRLVACNGDYEEMIKIFKNKSKIQALADVWKLGPRWGELRASFTDIDSLMQLPRIGPIVKYHLARNIGLSSGVSKPDLHLTAYAAEHKWQTVQGLVNALAGVSALEVGTADFCLWVWLSHARGQDERACCHGGFPLR